MLFSSTIEMHTLIYLFIIFHKIRIYGFYVMTMLSKRETEWAMELSLKTEMILNSYLLPITHTGIWEILTWLGCVYSFMKVYKSDIATIMPNNEQPVLSRFITISICFITHVCEGWLGGSGSGCRFVGALDQVWVCSVCLIGGVASER